MIIATGELDRFGKNAKKGILLHLDDYAIYSSSEAWPRMSTSHGTASTSKAAEKTTAKPSGSTKVKDQMESLPLD